MYESEAWIYDRAEDQLRQVAAMAGVARVARFPNLHPGKYGPVSCAVLSDPAAVLPDRLEGIGLPEDLFP